MIPVVRIGIPWAKKQVNWTVASAGSRRRICIRLSKDRKAAFGREAVKRGLHGRGYLLVALTYDRIVVSGISDRVRASGSVRPALR